MTPDAKGVLQKYQSEEAGIGSLSSDDSSSSHHHLHPVNGPTSYTSSSHTDMNDDHIDDMKSRLLGIASPKNKRLLKEDAVPSLHLHKQICQRGILNGRRQLL
ncbi:hypothetical protein Pmani_001548 [Petrolisthes manimaculis]|uniref:Uncharacterized protein n=1 Tax=Petrolisthes manimaculis TaxID=1843537 RepID=A0AAE1QKI0_9EUCA|nr:hypothetical protein Pmani_001548 [Petrolisthes manimaculis]